MKTKFALIVVVVAGLAGFREPRAAASTEAPFFGCKSGDGLVTDFLYHLESPDQGAFVFGLLCRDHVTTGWYWSVEVQDTAADGKCAHASAEWVKSDTTRDIDYGMWVCGDGNVKDFYTPVRNWTRYSYLMLGSFVDGGLVTHGFFSDF